MAGSPLKGEKDRNLGELIRRFEKAARE